MKTVTFPVRVSASFIKKLERRVRPLGMDANKIIKIALGAPSSLECLLNDSDLMFCGYVFPNRAAAQRAVNADYSGRKIGIFSKLQVTYLKRGKRICEDLYPAGARQIKMKVDRLLRVYASAKRKASSARAVLERYVGCPVVLEGGDVLAEQPKRQDAKSRRLVGVLLDATKDATAKKKAAEAFAGTRVE